MTLYVELTLLGVGKRCTFYLTLTLHGLAYFELVIIYKKKKSRSIILSNKNIKKKNQTFVYYFSRHQV